MTRLPIALLFGLLASAAFAGEPAPAEEASPACPKATEERAEPRPTAGTAKAVSKRPAGTPVRPASGGRSATPRWNSLLPGMFR